jgi:hypothetical protein
MATTTPNNGWPVPTSTDLVSQGAVAIEALGDAIDADIAAGLKAWVTFTPTISGGFTIGNGTFSNALYCKIGKNIHYNFVFTYGSTSSASALTFTLPVQARVANSQMHNGWANAGSGNYPLLVRQNSTTTVSVQAINAAGTYASGTALTTTIPGTWATGNIISITGTYEQA